MIFQYPVVALCVAIVTCITQAAGVYCQFESKPYFAKLWVRNLMALKDMRECMPLTMPQLSLAKTISLVLAVLAVWRFYRQLKSELANHKPMAKFLAFKLVVMLTFLQAVSRPFAPIVPRQD